MPTIRRSARCAAAAGLTAALIAAVPALPAAAQSAHGAYLSGSEPWTASECNGDTAVVAASDAAAQSDLYSAVTLAGALGTDCVILAGARDEPMPAAQQRRLGAAAGRVYVVGGPAAVPIAKLDSIPRYALDWRSGSDRWHTAAAVGRTVSLSAPAIMPLLVAPPTDTAAGATPEQRIGHVHGWFADIGLGDPIEVAFATGQCHAAAAACADRGTIYYTTSPSQIHGALMAHEYTHIWQHARTADVGLASLPAWVVEGFAEFIGHAYSPGESSTKRTDLCGAPLGEDNDLSRMGPGQYSESVYRAGLLAFAMLIEQHLWEAVIDYWNNPGSHQQRFRTAFGVDAAQWERDFQANACRFSLWESVQIRSEGDDSRRTPTLKLGWAFGFSGCVTVSACYPIDAIRLTPTVVWDTFFVLDESGFYTKPVDVTQVGGSAGITNPDAETVAANCADSYFLVEFKVFGEWHPGRLGIRRPNDAFGGYPQGFTNAEACLK